MNTPSMSLRLLVLPLALALVFLLLLAQNVEAGNSPTPTETHRVSSGDTLWDLASERTATGEDVRATVALIQRINHLEGGLIVPGQVLDLPPV
ncbi:MAG: LysM peptidoglycan-binding domain-containing protein [Acidimicrobiia bacterium]